MGSDTGSGTPTANVLDRGIKMAMPATRPTNASARGASAPESRPRLLIVDSSVDDTVQMRHALSSFFEVQVVTSARRAIHHLERTGYDLVIFDYKLPDLSAPDLIRAMRTLRSDEPFLVVSGVRSEQVARECLALGAFDYVLKSTEAFRALPRIVSRALSQDRLVARIRELEAQVALLERSSDRTRDPLTGLFTRQHFLQQCRARQFTEAVSIVILDVVGLGSINERFGDDQGDKVLQLLANLLGAALGKDDLACRYGDDELVVLLAKADAERAEEVAANVQADILQATHLGANPVEQGVRLRAGAATGVEGVPALIRTAEKSLADWS
ncbi:MAG: diguanylate cyclase [Chloroflexi bacterium]|nr:diguanylate cyclase [Chloroflexota bacterium]